MKTASFSIPQPIVSSQGGRASEELLIRMVGRNGEIIEPVNFLGVAEKIRLDRGT